MKQLISLNVNGETHEIWTAVHKTLLELLREDLRLTGTKHGCELGDRCLIGINALVMDGVKIGANSIVAGNTVIREGAEFPENSIIAGVPGKLVGHRDSGKANLFNAKFYYQNALNYSQGIERMQPAQLEALLAERSA